MGTTLRSGGRSPGGRDRLGEVTGRRWKGDAKKKKLGGRVKRNASAKNEIPRGRRMFCEKRPRAEGQVNCRHEARWRTGKNLDRFPRHDLSSL